MCKCMRVAHIKQKGLDDAQHASSSLFDVFDGIHAEPTQQALTFPFS